MFPGAWQFPLGGPPEPQIWLAGDGSGVGEYDFAYIPTAQRVLVELPVHSDSASDGTGTTAGVLYDAEEDRIWLATINSGNPREIMNFAPDIGIFRCGARIITDLGTGIFAWAFDDLGRMWIGRTGGTNRLFCFGRNDPDGALTVVNASGNYWDLLFDPVRRRMYAMNSTTGAIEKWNVDTLTLEASSVLTFSLASNTPRFIYAPDRDAIITNPDSAERVMVLDPDDLTGVRNTVTGSPGTGDTGIAYDTERGFLWTGDHFGERTVKINVDTFAVAAAIAHPAGSRHTGGLLYEPLTENYDGSGEDTGDRIWSVRIAGGAESAVMVIDPATDTIEDTISFPAGSQNPDGRTIALRPKRIFSSARVDPNNARFLWEGGEYLEGWWRAGAHNDISAGEVTRIVDLSGKGRHCPGGGGLHVASDAALNGHPSINAVAANEPHYQSDGFGIADLMGNANLGVAPYQGGDAFTIVSVYAVDSLPAAGTTAWKDNADLICGGLDYTADADGSGFLLVSYSSGSAHLMGAFYGPASDSNSKSTVTLASPSFGVPRSIVARKFPNSQQIGFWRHPTTPGGAPSNSGESVLTNKTAPFEFFHLTGSSRYSTLRWAETIVFSRALKIALLRDWLYERTIKPAYGVLI